MFPRVNVVKTAGKTYRYLQIVESVRQGGSSTKRVLCNLGRLDRIEGKLDDLVASLSRYCRAPRVARSGIGARWSGLWGPVLLARHLWQELAIGQAIDRLCEPAHPSFRVSERAFVLVANRLMEPTSEHGLARWLEHAFVCDEAGRRWEPLWRPVEKVTKEHRVKVAFSQLKQWYQTLDFLLGVKPDLERHLYERVRDLFHVKADVVFYDLTSVPFQRRRPVGKLRRHGKSRDGRPRDVQIVAGVVMVAGWPIAHHVFPGNTADMTTLEAVIRDIDRRFGVRQILFVADRGLASRENLQKLSAQGFRHLVGIRGRRSAEAAEVLARLRDEEAAWITVDEANRVQEIRLDPTGARYFVVDSAERKGCEESLRKRAMERTAEALEAVAESVRKGRAKHPAKIGARADRAMKRHHGHRYFSYRVSAEGGFQYHEDPEKLAAELLREGRYLLRTDDPGIGAAEAVEAYKELWTVEDGFRDLKDVIEMHPIWHKKDERICAHIFVATLALFLKRTLAHHLDAKGVNVSSTDALAAMKTVAITELDVQGESHRVVSPPGRDGRRVLSALGIRQIRPPQAPPQASHSSPGPM